MWKGQLSSLICIAWQVDMCTPKQTLPLPLQYKLAMPDDQFIFSSSWLPSPRLVLQALASYRADIRAISLRCAKVSKPLILFANLAALFCAQFKVLTWPLCGSQHTTPYSSTSLSSAVYCRCCMWFWMQMLTGSQENITFAVCVGCVTALSDWLLKLRMC